ncbi:hypothetical protein [Marinicrinis lubricantis]|uniref:Uncharacterized protein n=1 Tax=Marinicrinis lubricantis TaxID=2086470 RepID=A0ABW1IVJ0_9BACL
MGVKFGREYEQIHQELTEAISKIDKFYEMFEMSEFHWSHLAEDEQHKCAATLADDIFYALGEDPEIEVGSGKITYVHQLHHITVHDGQDLRVISLI